MADYWVKVVELLQALDLSFRELDLQGSERLFQMLQPGGTDNGRRDVRLV
jgi:hypothetical protein